MKKVKLFKEYNFEKIYLVILFSVLLLLLFLMVVKPFPLSLLPTYPNSSTLKAFNTTDLEQILLQAEDNEYSIEKNGLHYQVLLTTDSVQQVTEFYEDARRNAHLEEVYTATPVLGSNELIFGHDGIESSSDQNITGVLILDEDYDPVIIPNSEEQPNTRIIVLFQGFAHFQKETDPY